MTTLIIIGSTRPVRVGDQVAGYVADVAREQGVQDVGIDDLRRRDLPLLDEPKPPAMYQGAYEFEHSRDWSRTIGNADAVVLVTPQYNGGYPAALKNAIDYLYREWHDKPTLVVSYGTESSRGGEQVQQQLAQVLSVVGAAQVRPGVRFPLPFAAYGQDGRLVDATGSLAPQRDDVNDALSRLVSQLT